MGFEIVKDANDRYQVRLYGEPTWAIGMRSSSNEIESEMRRSAGLVVAFSIWSTLDREEAYKAIEVAKAHRMCVRIGLLPFDYPEEIRAWLPSDVELPGVTVSEAMPENHSTHASILQEENTSPLWLVMFDGKPLAVRQGRLPDSEIVELLAAVHRMENGIH